MLWKGDSTLNCMVSSADKNEIADFCINFFFFIFPATRFISLFVFCYNLYLGTILTHFQKKEIQLIHKMKENAKMLTSQICVVYPKGHLISEKMDKVRMKKTDVKFITVKNRISHNCIHLQ